MPHDLDTLIQDIRRCQICTEHLPLGPHPIIHATASARIMIASQAPGTRAHLKGKSFWDASGDRLRAWLGMDENLFYDARHIAIMPMGLCYPGRLPQGGDRPPRPECAPLWREKVLACLPAIRLTLLVGSYAQNHHLGRGTVTDRVRNFRDYRSRGFFPLPHPSWRTGAWEQRNPWFGTDVLPALRRAVQDALTIEQRDRQTGF